LSLNDLGAPQARKWLETNELQLARFLPASTRAGAGPGTLFELFNWNRAVISESWHAACLQRKKINKKTLATMDFFDTLKA